jgi:hypothetical protein
MQYVYSISRLALLPLLLLLTSSLACGPGRPRAATTAAPPRTPPTCSYRGVGFDPRDGVLHGVSGDPLIKIKDGRRLKIRYDAHPGPGGGRVEVQVSETEFMTSTRSGVTFAGGAPLPTFAYLRPTAPLRFGGVIIAEGGAQLQAALLPGGRLRVTLEASEELLLPRALSRSVRCGQVHVSPEAHRAEKDATRALALGESEALEGHFGVGLGGQVPFAATPGGLVEARLDLDAVERDGVHVLERRGAHTRLALRRRTYWIVGWVPSDLVRRESMSWGGSQQARGGKRDRAPYLYQRYRRTIVVKRQAFASRRCSKRVALFVRKRKGLAAAGAVESIGAVTPGREIVVVPQDSGWYALYLPKSSWWQQVGETDLLVRRAVVDRFCPEPR